MLKQAEFLLHNKITLIAKTIPAFSAKSQRHFRLNLLRHMSRTWGEAPNSVNDAALHEFLTAIRSKPTITSLTLEQVDLGPQSLPALYELIKNHAELHTVSITRMGNTTQCIEEEIEEHILVNNTSSEPVSHEELSATADSSVSAKPERRFKMLSFVEDMQKAYDDARKATREAWQQLVGSTFEDLPGTFDGGLKDSFATKILNTLTEHSNALRSLTIEINAEDNGEALTALAHLLQKHPSLEHLELDLRNEFNTHAPMLGAAIKNHPGLKRLALKGSALAMSERSKIVTQFIAQVSESCSIKFIELTAHSIDEFRRRIECFKFKSSVKHLVVHYDPGAYVNYEYYHEVRKVNKEEIVTAVDKRGQVEAGFNLSDVELSELAGCIHCNSYLTHVQVIQQPRAKVILDIDGHNVQASRALAQKKEYITPIIKSIKLNANNFTLFAKQKPALAGILKITTLTAQHSIKIIDSGCVLMDLSNEQHKATIKLFTKLQTKLASLSYAELEVKPCLHENQEAIQGAIIKLLATPDLPCFNTLLISLLSAADPNVITLDSLQNGTNKTLLALLYPIKQTLRESLIDYSRKLEQKPACTLLNNAITQNTLLSELLKRNTGWRNYAGNTFRSVFGGEPGKSDGEGKILEEIESRKKGIIPANNSNNSNHK